MNKARFEAFSDGVFAFASLFRLVQRIDRKTVFWNLLLLGGTVLIPFATTTLGSYPTTPAATFLYGLVLSSCASCYYVMLAHLVRSQAFSPEVGEATIAGTVRGYRMGLLVYASARSSRTSSFPAARTPIRR
jgi:uncharacterized membrane protein